MITSRTHGFIDYFMVAALVAAPWLFGFANFEQDIPAAATWTPIVVGLMILGLSLMTNYELSVARIVSMRTHLIMDTLAALFLIASPWLLKFADYVYLPHVLAGALELVVVALSVKAAYNPPVARGTSRVY